MLQLSKKDLEFNKTPRRQQELRLRPFADEIYKMVFGLDTQIERYDKDATLDIHFAIDVQLRLNTGQILLGQKKFLSSTYAKYNSLTVEYMQNKNERGDWFRLACQFYFTGYELLGNGFSPWVIVNWAAVVLATHKGQIKWQGNVNKDGHAQASFKYVDIDNLPDLCIIASSKELTP